MRVVAALIKNLSGKYLIGKRLAGTRKERWEFPGGKVKPGENERETLKRELREELGIEVKVERKLGEINFSYPDIEITLVGYICKTSSKEIKSKDHSSVAWVSLEEIKNYDLCEADQKLLEFLKLE